MALWLRGFDTDVFSQIGLVMIIGLAAKNAILIVEFSKAEHERGASLVDAALAGARLRLRAILMTAFAFILGVVPLVIAHGAGAASRRILGTTVMGGMLAATLIAIFIIPVTFYVSQWFQRNRAARPAARARLIARPPSGRRHRRSRSTGGNAAMSIVARNAHRRDRGRGPAGRLRGRPRLQAAGGGHAGRVPGPGRAPRRRPRWPTLPWWEVFQDPTLRQLIQEALASNYDCSSPPRACSRRAPRSAWSRSRFFPSIGYTGAGPARPQRDRGLARASPSTSHPAGEQPLLRRALRELGARHLGAHPRGSTRPRWPSSWPPRRRGAACS